jgi:hypothetical protein
MSNIFVTSYKRDDKSFPEKIILISHNNETKEYLPVDKLSEFIKKIESNIENTKLLIEVME